MPLTETELQQIRKEAEALYPKVENTAGVYTTYEDYLKSVDVRNLEREAHIAAVTAERERAKKAAIAYEKWCREELWQHEHREQRTFTDEEKYFTFINQYNQSI